MSSVQRNISLRMTADISNFRSSMDEAARASQGAADQSENSANQAEQAWSLSADKIKKGLAALGVGAVIKLAIDGEAANAKLQAQLGLTKEESARAGAIAGELYIGAYGESMEQVRDVVATVATTVGDGFDSMTEEQTTKYAKYLMNLSEISGEETDKIGQTIKRMVDTGVAGSFEEAFDLLTAASQKTARGMQGDLLDVMNEYAPFFKQLGIEGPEALGLIADASKKGSIEMDKIGDALKEFTIRSTDMSTGSVEAYNAIGLSASDMAADILAGGDDAATAFDQIVNGLLGIKDPTAQAAAAIALFGTPVEDLGVEKIPAFLASLASGSTALTDFGGKAAEVDGILGSTTAAAVTTFMRQLETLGMSIAAGVIPAVKPLLQLFADIMPAVAGVAEAVGTVVGAVAGLPSPVLLGVGAMVAMKAVMAASWASSFATAFGNMVTKVKTGSVTAGGAFGAFKKGAGGLLGMLGGPWGIAIGLGVTALFSWINSNQEAAERLEAHRAKVNELVPQIDALTGSLTEAGTAALAQRWIEEGVDEQFNSLGISVNDAAKAIQSSGQEQVEFRKNMLEAAGGAEVFKQSMDLSIIEHWAGVAGISVEEFIAILQTGGEPLTQLQGKLEGVYQGADGVNGLTDAMLAGLGPLDKQVAGLADFNGAAFATADAGEVLASKMDAVSDSLADGLGFDRIEFGDAFDKGVASGQSLEATLQGLGVSNDVAKEKIAALGDSVFLGADGMHYASQAAADAAKATEGVATATTGAGEAAAGAEPETATYVSALEDQAKAASEADTAAQWLYLSMMTLAGKNVEAEAVARAAAASHREVASAMQDQADKQAALDAAREEFGEGTPEYAAAERDLADAIDGVAEAQIGSAEASAAQVQSVFDSTLANEGLTAATTKAKDEMTKQRAAFIAMQPEADRASGKADQLADSIGLIPDAVTTSFDARTADAQAKGQNLYRTYNTTTGTWSSYFMTAGDAQARANAGTLVQQYNQATGTYTGYLDANTWSATTKINSAIWYANNSGGAIQVTANTSAAENKIRALKETYHGMQVYVTASGARFMADGGVITPAANGLVRDPMIAQGGSNILWAEPETDWEGYVPGALSKRKRSEELMGIIAEKFGGAYIPASKMMANGGVTGTFSAPSRPSLGGGKTMVQVDTSNVAAEVRAALSGWSVVINDQGIAKLVERGSNKRKNR